MILNICDEGRYNYTTKVQKRCHGATPEMQHTSQTTSLPPVWRVLITDSWQVQSGFRMNLNVSDDWRIGAGSGTLGRERG